MTSRRALKFRAIDGRPGAGSGLARRIQAGNITGKGGAREQSMPLGGFKQSGIGREGGREGVEAYTELKIVSIGL